MSKDFKDLRQQIRHRPSEKQQDIVPGELMSSESHRKVSYKVKDFSVNGLGITTTDKLLPDLDFVLLSGEQEIALTIVWGMACNSDGLYRYGLRVKDDFNMESFCRKFYD